MFARLTPYVTDEVGARLPELWEAFVEDRGVQPLEDFLRYLVDDGVITEKIVRNVLTAPGTVVMVEERGIDAAAENADPQTVAVLGAGAMGEVLIGRDPRLGRNVAIKRMAPKVMKDEDMVKRFRNEAQITAQLHHPNIISVYALNVDEDGVPSYAMSLVRGQDLADLVRDARARYAAGHVIDERHERAARLELFLSVCDAIAYAHDRGVVHRDLKTENIMVDEFNQVLVVDWGIAKVLGTPNEDVRSAPGEIGSAIGEADPGLTHVGVVIGTPAYMAPEQVDANDPHVGPSIDQWALGFVLYELVCLKRARPNSKCTLLGVTSGHREPIEHVQPSVPIPEGIKAIIERATQFERADRYPNVAALAADVRHFLNDEELETRPDNQVEATQRWMAHHRERALLIGVALATSVCALLILAGAVVAIWQIERAATAHERALVGLVEYVDDHSRHLEEQLEALEEPLIGIAYVAQYHVRRPGQDASEAPGIEEAVELQAALDRARSDSGVTGDEPVLRSLVALDPNVVFDSGQGPDPRSMGWWSRARESSIPAWHVRGKEPKSLIVSANVVVNDQPVGVAALDVNLDWLAETAKAEALPASAQAWLLRDGGRPLVHPATQDSFPHGDFVTDAEAGWASIDDATLLVWDRLDRIGLVYVVVGPEADLLGTDYPN